MYFDAKTKGYFPQNIKSIIKVEVIFFCLKILRFKFFLLIVLGYTLCNWNTLVCCISISCPPPSVFLLVGAFLLLFLLIGGGGAFSPYGGLFTTFLSLWGAIFSMCFFFLPMGGLFGLAPLRKFVRAPMATC